MTIGSVPEWFPEYGIDLGPASDRLPRSIDALRTADGLYVRRFARGVAAVNPDDSAHTLPLDGTRYLAEPHGGGEVAADRGTAGARVTTRAVSGSLELAPHSGAILLDRP
jgi:hypothetical protein